LEDGSETANGTIRYRLRLLGVSDRNGFSADAAGEVILFCEDVQVREWGAVLSVASSLQSRDGDDGNIFFSRAGGGQIEQAGWRSRFFAYRAVLRSGFLGRIRNMGNSSAPLLEALLLGIRDDLNLFEKELFKKSGCMHILALSGMHLGILTGMLYLLLGLFMNKSVSSYIAVGTALLYVLLTGCRPSLMRAAVMVVLAWVGHLTGRKSRGFPLLLTAFIIVCIIFPDSWKTLSFQLSFLALGGIILFGNSIAGKLVPFLPGWISFPIGSSVGAQIMASGFLLSWFQVLYPIGILSALFLTPLITSFIWVGMLYLFLADVPVLGFYLSGLADMIYHVTVLSAAWFARVPGIERSDRRGLIFYFSALILVLLAVYTPKVKRR